MARGTAQAYERTEGAATQPLPGCYVRRKPESTVLHEVVREHLETFLAQAREDGRGLPRHVENEFRRYIPCGQLSEGFIRVVCRSCGDELLVAFSCKGRTFCPSCCTRRMHDTAAHLVDRVFPSAPYRHYPEISFMWGSAGGSEGNERVLLDIEVTVGRVGIYRELRNATTSARARHRGSRVRVRPERRQKASSTRRFIRRLVFV